MRQTHCFMCRTHTHTHMRQGRGACQRQRRSPLGTWHTSSGPSSVRRLRCERQLARGLMAPECCPLLRTRPTRPPLWTRSMTTAPQSRTSTALLSCSPSKVSAHGLLAVTASQSFGWPRLPGSPERLDAEEPPPLGRRGVTQPGHGGAAHAAPHASTAAGHRRGCPGANATGGSSRARSGMPSRTQSKAVAHRAAAWMREGSAHEGG